MRAHTHTQLPHLPLFVLGDEVAVEVLQGHLGHGDPLLGVVTHGRARALAGHCHADLREARNPTETFISVSRRLQPNPNPGIIGTGWIR